MHEQSLPVADRDPWAINVENGALDLRSGELRPHRREDLATKLALVTYDPAAQAPRWRAFLRRVTGENAALERYLARVGGYVLTGSVREHALFFLFGGGRNGKGVYTRVLERVLGDYATTAQFSTLVESRRDGGAPRGDLVDLRGARLVSIVEAARGRLDEGLVKQLTGGDRIKAARKYRDEVLIDPTFKFLLASNVRPQIRGRDEGIWSRLRLIPFTVTIPPEERDKDLTDTIVRDEAAGVLAWAMAGCRDWLEHGLGEPGEVEAATREYRDDEDELGDFFAERCEQAQANEVRARELFRAYRAWAALAGLKDPWSEVAFAREMAARGFAKRKTKAGALWLGLSIRNEHGHPAEGDGLPEKTRHFPESASCARAQERVTGNDDSTRHPSPVPGFTQDPELFNEGEAIGDTGDVG